MTMTQETVTATATIDASALVRAATNVAMFADTDDTRPVLCCVHIRPGEDGQLVLESTDRYVAAQETVTLIEPGHSTTHPGHSDCPAPVTALDVLVNAKDLVRAVKQLKTAISPLTRNSIADDQPKVRIEHQADARFAQFTLTDNLAPDTTANVEVTEGEFPKAIDRFFADAEADRERLDEFEWDREVRFNAHQLAQLTKVEDDQGSKAARPGKGSVRLVTFQFRNGAKPAAVKVGDAFRAILMPVKKQGE